MPERCYNDDKVSFPTGGRNPNTGKPRRTQGIQAPGAVPKGWCQIQPHYLGLPPDTNPKIKAKADEVLSRLEHRYDYEVHTIDGTEYLFQLDGLYSPDGPDGDYSYPGIVVFRKGPGAVPWPEKTAKERGVYGSPRDGASVVAMQTGVTKEEREQMWKKHGGGVSFKSNRAIFGKYAVRPWHSTLGGLAIAVAITYGAGVYYLKARQAS